VARFKLLRVFLNILLCLLKGTNYEYANFSVYVGLLGVYQEDYAILRTLSSSIPSGHFVRYKYSFLIGNYLCILLSASNNASHTTCTGSFEGLNFKISNSG